MQKRDYCREIADLYQMCGIDENANFIPNSTINTGSKQFYNSYLKHNTPSAERLRWE